MSRVSGQLWQRAFTNRCNLVIDRTPLLIEGCIPYLLPSNLLSDLCHKMQICLFQHNLLAVTLSQSWRWSPWAVAWKLHPPILLKILRNLCPKSCLQFSTLLHQAQCLHTITLLFFFLLYMPKRISSKYRMATSNHQNGTWKGCWPQQSAWHALLVYSGCRHGKM